MTSDGVFDEPSPYPVMGFSILEAEDMDAALALLKDSVYSYDGRNAGSIRDDANA
nr:hypothetical protein [uncultured Desulfobacter sp.]